MRLPKTMRVTAVLAAVALALTACGGDDADNGADDTTTDDTGGDDTGDNAGDNAGDDMAGEFTTIEEGVLTVCSDIPYAPFEFEDEETGEYTGFDIDIMQAIAADLGLELNVVATGFDPIQSGTALAADQCDIAASAMTITEEREENLDFSDPYYAAQQSLLVPTGSDVTTLADLAGMRLGVQSATTGEAYAQENAPEDTELVAFENPGDLFIALEAGDISAILQDLPVNAERARQDEGVEVIETYDTGENYGLAVKEEGAEPLLEAVNASLQTLRDNGTYDEIFDKYFGTE